MTRERIPDEVKRFILVSIPSVPFLEALLLLRSEPGSEWNSSRVAKRLYIVERTASEILANLHAIGILRSPEHDPLSYCYDPNSSELRAIIDRVATTYAGNLVEVTNLIHAKGGVNNKAQKFADAFKWRKDS
ncbi:MAG: hypothetical protein V4632_22815 [Pseudomonadota bacterium]